MKLIDTDILIDHFHSNEAALSFITDLFKANEQLAISVVTVTEILSGMRQGEETKTDGLIT